MITAHCLIKNNLNQLFFSGKIISIKGLLRFWHGSSLVSFIYSLIFHVYFMHDVTIMRIMALLFTRSFAGFSGAACL